MTDFYFYVKNLSCCALESFDNTLTHARARMRVLKYAICTLICTED